MKKVLSGFLITFILSFNLPLVFAQEQLAKVSLVSQSRLWIQDRANLTFTIKEFSGSGISNAEIEISTSKLLGRSAIRSVINKPNSVKYKRIFETTNIIGNENTSQITLPRSKLEFDGAGTYAIRLTVYVRGEAQKLTSFISFLPSSVTLKNLKVATVLPLVINAGLTPSDLVLNNKAANSFIEKSGLNSLLTLGKSIRNVTWLLDADTLRLAQNVAANKGILHPELHDSSEPQIAGAQSWLAKAPKILNYANTYLIPTANTDPIALHNAGFNRLAKLALADTKYVSDTFAGFQFKKLSLAPKGDYTNSEYEWLKSNGVTFNLLNSNAYPAKDSTYTPNGVVKDGLGNKAPVVDEYASALFTDAISKETNAGMFQAAFAGDLLITALEQPGVERLLVLKPDSNQNGITNLKFRKAIEALNAPWVSPERLVNYREVSVGARNRETTKTKLNPISNNLIDEVYKTRLGLKSLIASAVENSQLDFATLRLATTNLDKTTKHQLRDATRLFLDSLNNAVRIMSAGTVVFPSESAKVPITIRNDLSVPIEVRILTSGIPAFRVIPDAVADLVIAPGRRKSIEIPTRLIGTDTAYLQLQIVDLNGKRIGEPIQIELTSSAYAQAAAWVIGGAFLLLLVFAIRNTLKRIRTSRETSRENT